MKVLEFKDDDFRDVNLSEEDQISFLVDRNRLDTLLDFLGYVLKTDGETVYAIGDGDVIEVGQMKLE